MRSDRAAIFWHIHQPFFVPDPELCEQVEESYRPLLELHARLGVPLSLNVSGGLLQRLADLAPDLVAMLRDAARAGWCEILGSGAHHPLLPLLPQKRARAQIACDVEAKRRLLDVSPRGFWPADLGWTHWMVPLLAEAGIEWTTVDSSAVVLGSVLPGWKPEQRHGHSVLAPRIEPLAHAAELGRAHRLTLGEHEILALARHHELSWGLVDLEGGVLSDDAALPTWLERAREHFRSGAGLLVIGDDGERINGRSLLRYEALLVALSREGWELCTGSAALAPLRTGAASTYLPTTTFQVDFSAWLTTPDDFACLRALEEVQRALELLEWSGGDDAEVRRASAELLPLEDSAFYFWKFARRTREPFLERLCALASRLAQARR